jgi:lysophospholipase L1-like esterase
MMRKTPVVNARGRSRLLNLALLVASTVTALILSEIVLRQMGWTPMYVSPERDRFWRYDPLLGWAHLPGQQGVLETPQSRISVRINDRGLRDREHSYGRPSGVKRILLLGDSFAWGYGVEAEERFSQSLESSMGVEVINAAVSGYSTDQELLWLRTEGVRYEFDLMILALAGNDIGDNQRQLVHTIYYKPRFVSDGNQLVLQGYPAPRTSGPGRLAYWLSQRSALAFFLVQRYFELQSSFQGNGGPSQQAEAAGDGPETTSGPFDLTIALLAEMRTIAESRDVPFMIVATQRWWNAPAGATYQDLIAALRAERYLVLDVEALPGYQPEAMVIPRDGHWNSAGHAFVAEQIQRLIETQQLVHARESAAPR